MNCSCISDKPGPLQTIHFGSAIPRSAIQDRRAWILDHNRSIQFVETCDPAIRSKLSTGDPLLVTFDFFLEMESHVTFILLEVLGENDLQKSLGIRYSTSHRVNWQ